MNFLRQYFILIADDNQDLAISLSILLRLVGFDVQTVHNGNDAMTVARIRRPDVLLLDIGLPGLNGFEVAGQFRIDERLKTVLIIAISGYSADMLLERRARDLRPLSRQARQFQDPVASHSQDGIAQSILSSDADHLPA